MMSFEVTKANSILENYLSRKTDVIEDSEQIIKAKDFAKKKHANQLDDSGKDYFEAHLVQVFNVLNQLTDDEDILSAGLLHDTIEDTNTTREELVKEFGKVVADLVMEVTHEGKKDKFGYYFPRLKTKDGITIKLADRNSNVSRMHSWGKQRQQQYLRKTKFWRSEKK